MSSPHGVLSLPGSTFRVWATFRELKNEPILGLRVQHLSDRGFIVVAVSDTKQAIADFAAYAAANSELSVYQIDGDPLPHVLWLGHWTHFKVRYSETPAMPPIPPHLEQSEKTLRRILSDALGNKRKR